MFKTTRPRDHDEILLFMGESFAQGPIILEAEPDTDPNQMMSRGGRSGWLRGCIVSVKFHYGNQGVFDDFVAQRRRAVEERRERENECCDKDEGTF